MLRERPQRRVVREQHVPALNPLPRPPVHVLAGENRAIRTLDESDRSFLPVSPVGNVWGLVLRERQPVFVAVPLLATEDGSFRKFLRRELRLRGGRHAGALGALQPHVKPTAELPAGVNAFNFLFMCTKFVPCIK